MAMAATVLVIVTGGAGFLAAFGPRPTAFAASPFCRGANPAPALRASAVGRRSITAGALPATAASVAVATGTQGAPALAAAACAAAAVAALAVSSRPGPQRGSRRPSLARSVQLSGRASDTRVNPATCWPTGKPRFSTDYPEDYDLSDPKGSFQRVGERILAEMVEELPELYEMPKKEVDWVAQSLEYNAVGGKMYRGLTVVETAVRIMESQGRTPTNRDLNRFAVLGWTVELLQACMLMADDMMDGSLTRRGSPCWYRLPQVGLLNTNDFLMVEMFVYKVLKRHFGQEEYFVWLLDLFLETTFQTECGQLLDSICANRDLEEFTTERWTLIVKYKTAFYSFYLPVALAMLVAGVRDPEAFDTAREVLLSMGVYFQAQDDYLDAFANPEELGKVGTDIQDKKCSWLFAQAYHQLSTPDSKEFLREHYGKCKVGSEEERQIKELYRSLGLQELYAKYEADTSASLESYRDKIEAVGLPWSIFERFFVLIYKRRK